MSVRRPSRVTTWDLCGCDCLPIVNALQRLINLENRVTALESGYLRTISYDTPGSFTFRPDTGVTEFQVYVYGGGGGGGCPTAPPPGSFNIAGGGGAGGLAAARFVVPPGSSYDLVVGDLGQGGFEPGQSGSAGQISVFQGFNGTNYTILTAYPGQGGQGTGINTGVGLIFLGGTGGNASITPPMTGETRTSGQTGIQGQSNVANSGSGGSAPPPLGGLGGAAAVPAPVTTLPYGTIPATAGGFPGAGGGGGLIQEQATSGAIQRGAQGAVGRVIIQYQAV